MTRNPGSIIMNARGPEKWTDRIRRIDYSSNIYMGFCVFVIIVFVLLALCSFVIGEARNGFTLLIASVALFGYGLNTSIQRIIRIGDTTDGLLGILRGRLDKLREDDGLLEAMASTSRTSLDEKKVNKLRYYLYTLFDVYEYAIHLIHNGYFPNAADVAAVYEDIIKKQLAVPIVAEIWKEQDKNGKYVFQNEYTPYLRTGVDQLLQEIEVEQQSGNDS